MDSLGKKIELLRKEKGYSLREFGKLCNLSHSYINDIEKGRTNPSLETLKILAENLNTSISYLIGEQTKEKADSFIKTQEEKKILEILNGHEEIKKLVSELKYTDDRDITLLLKTWDFVKSIKDSI